jgi:hypothetical protein
MAYDGYYVNTALDIQTLENLTFYVRLCASFIDIFMVAWEGASPSLVTY